MNIRRVEPIPSLLQKEERKHRDGDQRHQFKELDVVSVNPRLLDVIG